MVPQNLKKTLQNYIFIEMDLFSIQIYSLGTAYPELCIKIFHELLFLSLLLLFYDDSIPDLYLRLRYSSWKYELHFKADTGIFFDIFDNLGTEVVRLLLICRYL